MDAKAIIEGMSQAAKARVILSWMGKWVSYRTETSIRNIFFQGIMEGRVLVMKLSWPDYFSGPLTIGGRTITPDEALEAIALREFPPAGKLESWDDLIWADCPDPALAAEMLFPPRLPG